VRSAKVPFGVGHRAWFGAITIVYIVFLLLIPPFQTNDEDSHWMRAWSVAEGGLTCRPIPLTAHDLYRRFFSRRCRSATSSASRSTGALFKRGLTS
jgi:hypothetical protein